MIVITVLLSLSSSPVWHVSSANAKRVTGLGLWMVWKIRSQHKHSQTQLS